MPSDQLVSSRLKTLLKGAIGYTEEADKVFDLLESVDTELAPLVEQVDELQTVIDDAIAGIIDADAIHLPDGDASAPPYSFQDHDTYGMYAGDHPDFPDYPGVFLAAEGETMWWIDPTDDIVGPAKDSTCIAPLNGDTSGIGCVPSGSPGITNRAPFKWGFFGTGGVYIGDADPFITQHRTTSLFTCVSTTKGALLPRMTEAERDAIAVDSEFDDGLIVYNLDTHKLNIYNGTAWKVVVFA